MGNLSVKVKIFLLTTILTVMMIIIGGVGVNQIKVADKRMQKMYDENFLSVKSKESSQKLKKSIDIFKVEN
jgi:methyl-accepting chemotaxis protein